MKNTNIGCGKKHAYIGVGKKRLIFAIKRRQILGMEKRRQISSKMGRRYRGRQSAPSRGCICRILTPLIMETPSAQCNESFKHSLHSASTQSHCLDSLTPQQPKIRYTALQSVLQHVEGEGGGCRRPTVKIGATSTTSFPGHKHQLRRNPQSDSTKYQT